MWTAFLILVALIAFGLLGVLHKVADFQQCRPALITVFLFFWSGTFMLVVLFLRPQVQVRAEAGVIAVAAVCGFLASLAILAFQKGIRHGRIATSWLIINLSTAIPTLGSILLYREQVGVMRGLGLALMVVALLMLCQEKRSSSV